MLAIINFQKINEKYIKILTYLHKTLKELMKKIHYCGNLKPCKAVILFIQKDYALIMHYALY